VHLAINGFDLVHPRGEMIESGVHLAAKAVEPRPDLAAQAAEFAPQAIELAPQAVPSVSN
jgi:hypothetical protein